MARTSPTAEERHALVARILASPHFSRSARLRDFLVYVVERGIAESDTPMHEVTIAAMVFGRTDSQAGDDSIVRVHASQLRKRLETYFQSEGAHERLILEIPKGNYTPVFHTRAPIVESPVQIAPAPPLPERSRRDWVWPAAALVVLALGCLLWDDLRLRSEVPIAMSPYLNQFWTPFFNSQLPFDVVLADSNLNLLQNLAHGSISLEQYANRDYQKLIDSIPAEAGLREIGNMLIHRRYTSISDADLARKISLLAGRKDHVQITGARDFQAIRLRTNQVILFGSKRSNPWAELLDNELDFQYRFEGGLPETVIHNKKPKPGERLVYRGEEPSVASVPGGYCVVARIPNFSGKGKMVLVAGTETEATGAGGEFLLNEASLAQLSQALSMRPNEPFPDFEILLQTTRVGGSSPTSRIISARRH